MRTRAMIAAGATLGVILGGTLVAGEAEARGRAGRGLSLGSSAPRATALNPQPATVERRGAPVFVYSGGRAAPVAAGAAIGLAAPAAMAPRATASQPSVVASDGPAPEAREWCPSGRVLGQGVGFCAIN